MKKTLLIAIVLTFVASTAFAAGVFQNFNAFADGNLSGQGNWTKGSVGTSWVQVLGGQVWIKGGDTGSGDRTVGNEGDYLGMTGTIYVEFDILGGANLATSWSVLADADGTPDGTMARAYGTGGTARGRIDGAGIVTGQDPLTLGVWNHVKIVIDTATDSDTFYLNGVLLTGTNPISYTGYSTDILQRISFHKTSGAAAQDVYLDNLWVGDTTVPEPASMLALLTGLVGVVGFARRRK